MITNTENPIPSDKDLNNEIKTSNRTELSILPSTLKMIVPTRAIPTSIVPTPSISNSESIDVKPMKWLIGVVSNVKLMRNLTLMNSLKDVVSNIRVL